MGRRSWTKDDEMRLNIASDRELLNFAVGYLKPYRLLVILSILFIVVSSLLDLTPELLIRKIIDNDIANGDLGALAFSAILMILVYILSWILSFVYSFLTAKLGQSTIYDLRNDLFQKLMNQSQEYFDQNQSGKINSKLTNDVETLSSFLGSGLVDIIAAFIQLTGIIVIMLILDVTLAFISFATVPLLVIMALFIRGPVRKASRKTRKTIANVTDNLSENISGAKTTKTFARESKNKEEFSQVNKENYQASMQATKLFAFIFPLVGIISALGTAMILGYAGYQTAVIGNETYTVGLVATFMAYLTRFFRPVFRISMFYSTFQSALASLERVYLFLDEDIAVTNKPNTKKVELEKGKISFDNVKFGYNEDLVVFDGLTVEIEGKKTTALVGETGAGKSSFIKLIPRFYDVWSGSVKIDGIDIKDMEISKLRSHIGIVPQTTHLFNASIFENLKYGSPNASSSRVKKIAKLVGLHEFVLNQPEGYDTEVKEGGSRLSTGQRQLISFARALIKDPKILILDEATSSLDPISEIRVQEALEKLIEGRTVIAIAHRLSTIRNADRILVLDEGEIIQDGSHQELVRKKGKYQELYLKQFLGGEQEISATITDKEQ